MTDDVARAKYEHEYKPLGEYIAAKLSDVYDLPAGLTLEWESCPTPRPLVNPRDAAALRQLGLADNQFDVSPDLEKP